MKKLTLNLLFVNSFVVITTGLFLASCTTTENYQATNKPRANSDGILLKQKIILPFNGDDGVIIARTNIIGASSASSITNKTPDCDDRVGLGITIETSRKEQSYLLDSNAKPCDKAKVIFNGRDKIHQRATVQNIGISFIDALGPLPAQQQKVLDVSVPAHLSNQPENYAIAPQQLMSEIKGLNKKEPDNFEKELANWQKGYEKDKMIKQSEKLLADVRNVGRLSYAQLLDAHQRKIVELSAKLRNAEKNAELQDKKQHSLVSKLQATQGRADSAIIEHDNKSAKLSNDLEQLKFRISQMNESQAKAKKNYNTKENIYKRQIHELSGDLKVAEVQASKSRQAIVMEAAKKIAEAERLAYAARVVEKDAMEREASRLKREANTLMNRAIDIGKGRKIILPGMSHIPNFQNSGYKKSNASSPLESLPIILREKDEKLANIFTKALKYIEPKAGKWNIAWELSAKNTGITKEEWSIVAETSFSEFLEYVSTKVKETHNVQLKFERFDENKLFVISD